MMAGFTLDDRLKKDCFYLGKLDLSHFLLMNNALFSWFILVPETEVFELIDLDEKTRKVLYGEIDDVARFVRNYFSVDKLNIATIGNVVNQLHIHVIGRRKNDRCWPGVVWGRGISEPYSDEKLKITAALVKDCFPDLHPFTGDLKAVSTLS